MADSGGEGRRPSLSGSAAILILAGAITTGLHFVIGIALANTLSKGDFATYKQVYLLFGIVTPLFSLALPGSLLYFIPRLEGEQRARLVAQTLLMLGVFGAVFGIALWATADLWAQYFTNPDLADALRLFAVVPLFMLPASALSNVAVAFGRARLSAEATLAINAAHFALVGGAALLTRDLRWILVATIASAAVQGLTTVVVSRSVAGSLPLGLDVARAKEQFAYSVPLAMSGLAGLLAYQTDRLLVSISFSPELFAVYVIGAVEVPLVSMVGSSVNSVVLPKISELHAGGRTTELVGLYREAVRKTAVVVLPFFGFLMFLAEPFITFLYRDYAASVPIFRIYLILLPLRVASYGLILQAVGRTRDIFKGSLYYLVGNLVISWLLLKAIGLTGPAWGTVVATIAIAVWYLIRSGSSIGVAPGSFLPWKPLFWLLASSTAAGAAALAVVQVLGLELLYALVVGFAVFGPLCMTLGRVSGGITAEDVARARAWVSRMVTTIVPTRGA